MSKPITLQQWADLAPPDEQWIPMTYNGSVLYDRKTKQQAFVSLSPDGAQKYRAMFRTMAGKARALGFRKAGGQ